LPDIKAFNKDMHRNTKTYKAYSMALSRNVNYFKNPSDKQEKNIEGLITSSDFLQDFSIYLPATEETEKRLTGKVVLSPVIGESEISASVKGLSDVRARIDGEIRDLDSNMKMLSLTTEEKAKTVREEIKEIQRKIDKQIEKAKPKVIEKTRRIQKKYHKEVTKIIERFERQLRFLHENQAKLEKMQKHLKAEINLCEARIDSSKSRKNKRSEIRWTEKLKEIRKKLPSFEKGIRNAERKIEELEIAKKLEISQQRIMCDTRIDEANKILRELEASRGARIKMKQKEITALKDTTFLIINQMNEMTKLKKVALNEVERIGLPKKEKAPKLIYLPFYFVRYEMEARNRYAVYPPSIVSGMGILTKMKGVFGAEKMKALLQPRSKAIALFLNQFLALIQKNPMFEKEVTDAGIQDSVLRVRKLRVGVKRGLRELKNENWISKNELQNLSKLLYIYA
jgi:DNA repair exonuclease SbcCD ATPase subunit